MKGHTYKRCACSPAVDVDGRRVTCNKRHGSWFFIHDLTTDTTGKRSQARKGGFPTERLARAALTEALASIHQGTYIQPTRQTVSDTSSSGSPARAGSGRAPAAPTRSTSTSTSGPASVTYG